MKKLLMCAIVAAGLMSSSASAKDFDGFYTGANVGYESFNDSASGTDLGSQGINVGGFAGYGKTFGILYLGGEGGVAYGDADESTNGVTNRHTYDINADLRAGVFALPNTLLFAKVGAVRSEFDQNATDSQHGVYGAQFGLGAETAVASNITARVDWTYTDYQTYNVGQSSYAPTSNSIKLGVAYNF